MISQKRFLWSGACALLLLTVSSGLNNALAQTTSSITQPNSKALTLIENAQPRSVIVLAADADKDEQLAARELQEYLQRISGAALPLVPRADNAQFSILLGQAAITPQLQETLRSKTKDPASFVLQVKPDAVRILGRSPEGTLFGAYELLEQLGVRWFMPDEIGTVIPTTKTVQVAQQETVQEPSFNGRWHGGSKVMDWARHVRMGGPYFPSSHGIPGTEMKDFETHPEYFALVNGERKPSQLCVSNPAVLQRAVAATKEYFRKNADQPWIGLGPNDGSGFCECPNCQALDGTDWDPFSNERSVTDRYLWFFNKILDGIHDEFPTKKVCFYSYHSYMRAPTKVKPNPLIVPAFAPIALCRIHGLSNPICPERSYYKTLMTDWGKILPEVYERGYWFNLADPGFPFSEVHKMRDEIPVAHDLGIKGWRVETINHWGSETPSLYIAAKLMWNHKANVDALLADFYDKFFGPAREPMARYFTMMDAALRDGDYHTGCSFDMPLLYPEDLRKKARRELDTARSRAGDGIYAQRVAMFRSTFDYLETFIAMQKHAAALQFAGANRELQRLDAMQKAMIEHKPELVNPRGAVSYLQRFFRQPVEQGYTRTSNGNELVAGLKDEWDFAIDPQGIGEATGLWKSTVRGGNWRPLKTSTASWSDQGLRTYKGQAWYRQTVDIPARFAGKRIFLWFGGVDEKAKVWVNGQLVGISHDSSFLPFELDATSAIAPGKPNVVVVSIINQVVNELGTGGITSPVMFYAPAAGADAKLENVRELKPTFP